MGSSRGEEKDMILAEKFKKKREKVQYRREEGQVASDTIGCRKKISCSTKYLWLSETDFLLNSKLRKQNDEYLKHVGGKNHLI
ncbi:hypothetical protein Tco_0794992 [Tanacetum coccineum]